MPKPENLKPFTKDDKRASKAGKKSKRGVSLKTALKKLFAEDNKDGIDPDDFVKALGKHAMGGNGAIARLIIEYIDGKVKDEIEIGNPDGQEFNNKVVIEFIDNNSEKLLKGF